MPMKLYAHPDKYLTKKILIAASFAELDIEVPKSSGGPEEGRIPVLETEKGCIFSTNAIARYVSRLRRDVGLYGQNLLESGAIDSWVDFCTHELEVPLVAWTQQANIPKEVVVKAKGDVQKALTVLDNHLLHFTFMAGDTVTLADISIVSIVHHGMRTVLTTEFMSAFANLRRWFSLITAQPQVSKVLGKVESSGAASSPKAAPKAAKASPKAASPKAAPKEEKKAAPKAEATGAVDEAAIKAVGDDIRVLKEKLKGEGITGKKLNEHPEVAALVAKLSELKAGGGAAPASPAAKPAAKSPAAKPAAKQAAKKEEAKGAVDEDAIKAVGDEIRVLKEKLKGEGVTGKKLNEHPEVAGLVARLSELKAGGGAASAAPAAKKAEGGAAADAEARKKQLKACIKEGGKRGVEIEGAADMGGLQFFCTMVDAPDGDLDLVVECMNAMNTKSDPTEEERKGGSGAIGKMIFSAGTDQLAVVAYVPEAKQKELSCEEWLKQVLSIFSGDLIKGDKTISVGRVKTDSNKGVFPLKIREAMIVEANNFLRKLGLFPQDDGSDDDEYVFGDDDFPSM